MNARTVVSRQEWDAAREELLTREKAVTKARDEVNALRRGLPMVEIGKDYVFDTPDGPRSLGDLFDGRGQLIIYHFMFDTARPAPTQPAPAEGCVSCSHVADSIGHLAHINARDTTLVMVSRAPLDAIEEFKARMGWTVPWVSSAGSDFNHDFTATVETEQYAGEIPGVSVLVREGDRILLSYWTSGRGLDHLLSTYAWLDLTPGGRQEGWDGMPDLDGKALTWLRHHDRYTEAAASACCGAS
ncbi:DUF899 domain-containing protein [Pseudonocardia sp. TRM90224]|uniref:DUF899 domain-containing protein n=1 Tax=Pseudonocardia sp. TRM90224 TaxID=2812678 RepID=UPI001E3A0BD4|nr:DUF899 domain-containing protein [Pseudonocardia sp. TRM90224]